MTGENREVTPHSFARDLKQKTVQKDNNKCRGNFSFSSEKVKREKSNVNQFCYLLGPGAGR